MTFGDADAQKVTYNGRYLDIVDDFLYRYLEAHQTREEAVSTFKVKDVVIDYLAPSRLGDRLVVRVDESTSLPCDTCSGEGLAHLKLGLSFLVAEEKVTSVQVTFAANLG